MSSQEDSFPHPMEAELIDKSWQELHSLATQYELRADNAYFDGLRSIPLEERSKKARTLMARAMAAKHQADILRAIEILDNPHPDPRDLRFAKRMVWVEKLNKRVLGRLPTHPSCRAVLPDLSGEINPTSSPQEEILAYEKQFRSIYENVMAQALKELPDPEGEIFSAAQLGLIDLPE